MYKPQFILDILDTRVARHEEVVKLKQQATNLRKELGTLEESISEKIKILDIVNSVSEVFDGIPLVVIKDYADVYSVHSPCIEGRRAVVYLNQHNKTHYRVRFVGRSESVSADLNLVVALDLAKKWVCIGE